MSNTILVTVLALSGLQDTTSDPVLELLDAVSSAIVTDADSFGSRGVLWINVHSVATLASLAAHRVIPDDAVRRALGEEFLDVRPDSAIICTERLDCRVRDDACYAQIRGMIESPPGRRYEVTWVLHLSTSFGPVRTIARLATRAWFRAEGERWVMERKEYLYQMN
jgi:hypothetical protein